MAQGQTFKEGAEILSSTWILLSAVEAVELGGKMFYVSSVLPCPCHKWEQGETLWAMCGCYYSL